MVAHLTGEHAVLFLEAVGTVQTGVEPVMDFTLKVTKSCPKISGKEKFGQGMEGFTKSPRILSKFEILLTKALGLSFFAAASSLLF